MNTPEQTRRIVENLMRTIEVTEIALHLRYARLRAQHPEADAMQQVMREVRVAKEHHSCLKRELKLSARLRRRPYN